MAPADQLRAATPPRPTSVTADAGVRARLEALEARIAALEAQEAARTQRQRIAGLRRGDQALAAQLLPALAFRLGSCEFLSDYLSETRDPNLRYIVAGRSTKTIGRLLSRIEGVAFGDDVLEAAGKVNNRRQWRVRRIVS